MHRALADILTTISITPTLLSGMSDARNVQVSMFLMCCDCYKGLMNSFCISEVCVTRKIIPAVYIIN